MEWLKKRYFICNSNKFLIVLQCFIDLVRNFHESFSQLQLLEDDIEYIIALAFSYVSEYDPEASSIHKTNVK